MAVTHDLKTLPVYFDAVERGEKTFEIRRDDRGFQKGDTVRLLRLSEQPGVTAIFTSRLGGTTNDPDYAVSLHRRISWILTGGQFGLEPSYVILALGLIEDGKGRARNASPYASTPPEVVADAAERILRESDRPLKRGALVKALRAEGVEISAADAAKNVGTILWRRPDRFENVPGEGYRLRASDPSARPLSLNGEG